LKTKDFDIQVPRSMVAQEPANPRDASRLMVVENGLIEHASYWMLPDYMASGDVLVMNNSRVIPARLRGYNANQSEMSSIVVLLLEKLDELKWSAMTEAGSLNTGDRLVFGSSIEARVLDVKGTVGVKGGILCELMFESEEGLESIGEAPVPPYISSYKGDPEKYQTIYSLIKGSSAAPTAGLHFTPNLLRKLEDMGVKFAFVTLHVSIDTFMPVTEESPEDHQIYTEICEVPEEAAETVNECKAKGGRVFCVGTTSVRTVESCAEGGFLLPQKKNTDLYILPGYKWKMVDYMLTNFHYPKSTNIMMTAAFMGYDNLVKSYDIAVNEGYRFYSFGDSMLLKRKEI